MKGKLAETREKSLYLSVIICEICERDTYEYRLLTDATEEHR
jgi:hypothetical protein